MPGSSKAPSGTLDGIYSCTPQIPKHLRSEGAASHKRQGYRYLVGPAKFTFNLDAPGEVPKNRFFDKWLETPEEVETPKYVRTKKFGRLTAFTDELEQALNADAHRSKQDQRTGKALFVQIKASGYLGGYSRVTDGLKSALRPPSTALQPR